jgi:hypothetical protein
MLAGDQDPGHRPVTGQPLTGLGSQGAAVGHPTHRPGAALEAVQVDQHRQLGPDPTSAGELAAFELAAGQLGQGIGPPLATSAVIVAVGWAGQGFQGGQQDLAGFGLQEPVHRDQVVQGGREPQAALLVASLGPVGFVVGVGDQPQMPQDLPQPGWVEPPGRVQEHWFGLGRNVAGEVVVP